MFFIIIAIFSLAKYGLRPGIDFTGGSLLEIATYHAKNSSVESVSIDSVSVESLNQDYQLSLDKNKIENLLEKDYQISSISETTNSILIKGPQISNQEKNRLISLLKNEYEQVTEIRFETIGPSLGRELVRKTALAIIFLSIIIILYISIEFKNALYGICAIVAMFHDTLILLGALSLFSHYFQVYLDVLSITAILTTLSFSIHDTVVIFNRIRELQKKYYQKDFSSIANVALLETLARSLNNSLTIIIMLLSLFLIGGESLRFFILALLIGAIVGTYSSSFTATPLLIQFEKYLKK